MSEASGQSNTPVRREPTPTTRRLSLSKPCRHTEAVEQLAAVVVPSERPGETTRYGPDPGRWITNHVVAGALIGAAVSRPTHAFALGVASHVVMDTIPHWGHPDQSLFLKVAVVDGLFGLATMATLARAASPERRAAVVAGMLGACLPDADKPCDLFFGRSPFPGWVDDLHRRIQNEAHERMPFEAIGGVLGSSVARALLRRLG